MNCTQGHAGPNTTVNDTTCHCYAPFYGVNCEQTLAYWTPVSLVLVLIDALIMVLGLAWTMLRVVTMTRARRWSKYRLADVVVLLNGAAMLMQLITDVTPTPSLTGMWPLSLELGIVTGILVILSMATWMATSALTLGYVTCLSPTNNGADSGSTCCAIA